MSKSNIPFPLPKTLDTPFFRSVNTALSSLDLTFTWFSRLTMNDFVRTSISSEILSTIRGQLNSVSLEDVIGIRFNTLRILAAFPPSLKPMTGPTSRFVTLFPKSARTSALMLLAIRIYLTYLRSVHGVPKRSAPMENLVLSGLYRLSLRSLSKKLSQRPMAKRLPYLLESTISIYNQVIQIPKARLFLIPFVIPNVVFADTSSNPLNLVRYLIHISRTYSRTFMLKSWTAYQKAKV